MIGQMESGPKYIRLKQAIIDAAQAEQWPDGYRLPSENELVKTHEVSRSTVRQALEELEREGLLSRQRGRGTFFTPNGTANIERHHLVGISTTFSGFIYPAIVRGAEEALLERGYNAVIGPNLLSDEMRRTVEDDNSQWRLDGLLFEPRVMRASAPGTRVLDRVKAIGIPYVMLNWTSDDPEVCFVAPDDIAAGETVGRYLVERGHRQMAFVGTKGHQPSLNRYKGFKRVLDQAGIELSDRNTVLLTDMKMEERSATTYEGTRLLLEDSKSLPLAIFYYNDSTAADGYHAIQDAGLRIPDDISVISYDDSELGRALIPRLTTMEHPKGELGRWAARILLDRIERPQARFSPQVKMRSTIIDRDSVRTL
jgi:GntR family transcriptional regulator, arabinose operon transcriptional repressor